MYYNNKIEVKKKNCWEKNIYDCFYDKNVTKLKNMWIGEKDIKYKMRKINARSGVWR